MKFAIKKRGAIVLALWVALAMLVLSFILFVFFSSGWWVWWSLIAVPLPASLGFYFYLKYTKVSIIGNELIINRGTTFTSTQRFALKNIIGISSINTPLLHILGLSFLMLHTSGTTLFIFALSKKDATVFSSTILSDGDAL